jgi:hypothetical protein
LRPIARYFLSFRSCFGFSNLTARGLCKKLAHFGTAPIKSKQSVESKSKAKKGSVNNSLGTCILDASVILKGNTSVNIEMVLVGALETPVYGYANIQH